MEPSNTLTPPPVPDKVKKKFHSNGTSKEYLGHSVICPLPLDSPFRQILTNIRNDLRNSRFEHLFANEALLPEANWHTTIFICLRDQERGPDAMPREDLGGDNLTGKPYDDLLEYTRGRVGNMRLDQQLKPPYYFEVTRQVPRVDYSIGLKLEPIGATKEALGKLRERLSQQTRIVIHDEKNYVSHITLAYLLQHPTKEESTQISQLIEQHLNDRIQTIEFDRVGLFSFRDMQSFVCEVEL